MIRMMTKIVVDTNIFISVLIGKEESASREIFRQCLQRKYQPLMGNALFAEYNDVLNRDRIISLCPLTDSEKIKLLKAFMSVCSWVKIYYLWRPNLLDEGDNHLIELAVAGNARAIVTNNIKDFKQSQLRFRGLQILTPKQFLDLNLS